MKGPQLLALLATSIIGLAPLGATVVETKTSLGRYILIEEVSSLGPNEPPIMHVNQNWTKLRLRFLTDDSVTRVDVIDTSSRLEIEIEAAGCFTKSWPVSYGADQSGLLLSQQMEKTTKALFKLCTTLTPEQKAKHLLELRQARADFPTALNALKAKAGNLFGGWRRRCIRYSSEPPGSPFWEPDCVRYSARAN